MGARGLATSHAAVPSDHAVIGAPSQDDALHRYLRELTARGLAGQRALWLHLSRFEASGSRDRHVEIACKVVEELIKHFVGRMFLLESGDIVLICKDLNEKITQDAIELLRDLFQNDPSARDGGLHFCSMFDLETDYARFAAHLPPLRATAAKAARPAMRATAKPVARPQPARAPKPRPAAGRRHLRTAVVLAALALLIAGEGLLAYRSSRQPWIFDTEEARGAHQVRNPLTGAYSGSR
jgi:hypothetical protein